MLPVRRLLKIFATTLFLLLGGVVVGVWLGQDRIISLFVTELNRYLRVPVQASRLEVSVLDQFPRLSVTLHDVVMSGSVPTDTVKLARARRLYCAFNAWDLLTGDYRLRAVTLADARVHVRRTAAGQPNYLVLRPDTTAAAPDESFALALDGVRLERVRVVYEDEARAQHFALQTPGLRAALTIRETQVDIAAEGLAHVETLRLGPDDYFRAKDLSLHTTLVVDRAAQQVRISPSTVRVGPAAYTVGGTVGYQGATTQLDVRAEATDTDIQAVLALLPPRLTRPVAGYRSRGRVYFAGTVRGELSDSHNPRVEVQFGCQDASFFHPDYQQAVDHVRLTGTFSNGAAQTAATAVLRLQQVRGQLSGRPFSGELELANFRAPQLRLQVQASLEASRALRFFPVAAVRAAQGEAELRLRLAGPWATLRTRPTAQQASGELLLRDLTLRLRDFREPFAGLQGHLQLRGADVAIPALSGRLGNSDFQVRGTLRNVVGWALQPRERLQLDATLAARLLDFNQLLYVYQPAPTAGARGSRTPAAAPGLRVPARLGLTVQVSARQVRYRRLRGRNLRGNLRLAGQVFSSSGLALTAAGGRLSVRGTVDARQSRLLKASTVASCQQVPLDSLFYVFENFGQQFITQRHLRGVLTATAESDTYFNEHLAPLTDRLEAEVHATVRNGELLNFEPLQKLSFVASRATLRHLRFAELQNRLYVQSRTVYVPSMDIRSNVKAASLIRVTGTHTFDQQMDYHVQIPLLPGLLPQVAAQTQGPALRLAIQGNEHSFTVRPERGLAVPAPRPGQPLPPVATRPAPAATPEAPAAPTPARPSFELKKPAKKPAQPQAGEYFEF